MTELLKRGELGGMRRCQGVDGREVTSRAERMEREVDSVVCVDLTE